MADIKLPGQVTIAQLIAGTKPGNVSFVDIYVQKPLTEDMFLVSDKKNHIRFHMDGNHKLVKWFVVGNYLRLWKPSLAKINDKDVLHCDPKFEVCSDIKTFDPKKLSKTDCQTFQITDKPHPLPVDAVKPLLDVAILPSRATITLYLKVVFITADKMGVHSLFRVLRVRDITGNNHYVTVYGNIRNSATIGQVYKFVGFTVLPNTSEPEKPGLIQSKADSQLLVVNDDICEQFKSIEIADSNVRGIILGNETINFYDCCHHCKRSKWRTESKKCQFCREKETKSPCHDFSFILIVSDEDTNIMKRVMVFRSHFDWPFNTESEAEIKSQVSKLRMQSVSIMYDKSEIDEQDDFIKARQLTFIEYDKVDEQLQNIPC